MRSTLTVLTRGSCPLLLILSPGYLVLCFHSKRPNGVSVQYAHHQVVRKAQPQGKRILETLMLECSHSYEVNNVPHFASPYTIRLVEGSHQGTLA